MPTVVQPLNGATRVIVSVQGRLTINVDAQRQVRADSDGPIEAVPLPRKRIEVTNIGLTGTGASAQAPGSVVVAGTNYGVISTGANSTYHQPGGDVIDTSVPVDGTVLTVPADIEVEVEQADSISFGPGANVVHIDDKR